MPPESKSDQESRRLLALLHSAGPVLGLESLQHEVLDPLVALVTENGTAQAVQEHLAVLGAGPVEDDPHNVGASWSDCLQTAIRETLGQITERLDETQHHVGLPRLALFAALCKGRPTIRPRPPATREASRKGTASGSVTDALMTLQDIAHSVEVSVVMATDTFRPWPPAEGADPFVDFARRHISIAPEFEDDLQSPDAVTGLFRVRSHVIVLLLGECSSMLREAVPDRIGSWSRLQGLTGPKLATPFDWSGIAGLSEEWHEIVTQRLPVLPGETAALLRLAAPVLTLRYSPDDWRARDLHQRVLGQAYHGLPGYDREHQVAWDQWMQIPASEIAFRLSRCLESLQPCGDGGDEEQQVEQYVTLDQAAALVNRSKTTLRRRYDLHELPDPDVLGKGGKPHEWKWSKLRPELERLFNRPMPGRFPTRQPPG